jgi:hypothetical protein
VSNGCHWVDHFLHLNDFCAVTTSAVVEATNGTLNVSIQLDNGAFFSMVLTDVGSQRIGMQNYVELRANDVTVKIANDSTYMAENRQRILRRQKHNKLASYAHMYRQIARQIATEQPGDSRRSVEVSAALVLHLEDEFMNAHDKERLAGATDSSKSQNRCD